MCCSQPRPRTSTRRSTPRASSIVRNLLEPLSRSEIRRFDVSFVPKKKNLDSFIGRAAHICFLDQVAFMAMLINVYREFLL